MNKIWLWSVAVAVAITLPKVVYADTIVVSLGNTAPTNPFDAAAPLVSGNTYGSAVYSSSFVAPFFTDFCGNEIAPTDGVNCDKSWTFNYLIRAGQTITASLSLGIADIDSASAANQVSLYQVNAGDALTGALNTAAEALHGGRDSVNTEFDVFTFSLSNFGALSGGSATVHLTLQDPSGLFGISDTNGAYVISSSLNISTQARVRFPSREAGLC